MTSRNNNNSKSLPPGGGGQPPQLPPLGHTPQIPPRGTIGGVGGGGATAALLAAGGGNYHKNSSAPLQPQMSERYIEALKVLSEDTMSKACDLLLSEKDYETKTDPNDSDAANTKTDMEQLLAMYEQVQKAAKIVKQLAPVEIVKSSQAADVLGIPKLPTSTRGGGGGPQTSKKPGSSIASSSSSNISSLHSTMKRGTMSNPKMAHHHHSHSHHQAAQQRARSMNNDMNKKPRIMSLSTAPPLSRSRSISPPPLNPSAPPPTALNFLAKLNKDIPSSASATKEGGDKNSNKGLPVAGQKRGRSDSTASAASIQSNKGQQRGRSDSTVSAASVASITSRSSRTSNKPTAAPAPASNRGGRPQRASSQRASQAIKESASSPPPLYVVTGDGNDGTRGVEGEDVDGGGDDSGTNTNKRTTKSPPTRMQPSRAASRKG